mmetsp:Transcript_42571/g.95776  ORF Transcript_42571/g.95776 Transcript_42571/m.95776 type:complete len:746 (-) Transcript_42571:34-2271(-)
MHQRIDDLEEELRSQAALHRDEVAGLKRKQAEHVAELEALRYAERQKHIAETEAAEERHQEELRAQRAAHDAAIGTLQHRCGALIAMLDTNKADVLHLQCLLQLGVQRRESGASDNQEIALHGDPAEIFVKSRHSVSYDEVFDAYVSSWQQSTAQASKGSHAAAMCGMLLEQSKVTQVGYLASDGLLPRPLELARSKQLAEAEKWYMLGAKHGDPNADWLLGRMKETSGDDASAFALLEAAASGGHIEALVDIGFYAERGKGGCLQDDARAYDCYLRARRAGSTRGKNNLAKLLIDGRGFRRPAGVSVYDIEMQAVELFVDSARCGYAVAHFNLGLCYEAGRGVGTDLLSAERSYQRASEDGHAGALGALAALLFRRALRMDPSESQFDLFCRSRSLLYRAADAGSPEAKLLLGWQYEIGGGGLSRDAQVAAKHYDAARRAAEGSGDSVVVAKAHTRLGAVHYARANDILRVQSETTSRERIPEWYAELRKAVDHYSAAAGESAKGVRHLHVVARDNIVVAPEHGLRHGESVALAGDVFGPGSDGKTLFVSVVSSNSLKLHQERSNALEGSESVRLPSHAEIELVTPSPFRDPEALNCLGLLHEQGYVLPFCSKSSDPVHALGMPAVSFEQARRCYELAIDENRRGLPRLAGRSRDALVNLAHLLEKGLGRRSHSSTEDWLSEQVRARQLLEDAERLGSAQAGVVLASRVHLPSSLPHIPATHDPDADSQHQLSGLQLQMQMIAA